MMTSNRSTTLGVFLATAAVPLAAGCSSFKVADPPPGFVEVSSYGDLARYKALDNVGLNVRAFDNHEGGTIEYWSGDLKKKLTDRGYELTAESAVISRNGRNGRRYDFDYVPLGKKDDAEARAQAEANGEEFDKFYTVCIFVTKEQIVVMELAGDQTLAPAYRSRVDTILGEITVGGGSER